MDEKSQSIKQDLEIFYDVPFEFSPFQYNNIFIIPRQEVFVQYFYKNLLYGI